VTDFRRLLVGSIVIVAVATVANAAVPSIPAWSPVQDLSVGGVRAQPSRTTGPVDIWARAGTPLVISFRPSADQLREGLVTARLSGGAKLYAPIWWVGPGTGSGPLPRPSGDTETAGAAFMAIRAAAWMDIPTDWEAIPAAVAQRRTSVSSSGNPWRLVIDIPPEAEGQDLVLDGRRIATGWMRRAPFDTPRRSEVNMAGWTGACIAVARRSPLDRWRARLVAGEPLVAPGPAQDEFADKVVESLAEQIESEWSEGLDRLAAADAALAKLTRERLALIAEFGTVRSPVWTSDEASLTKLRRDMLSPSFSPQAKAERAREWLSAQARHAVWVADDAAVVDAVSGRPAAVFAGLMLSPGSGPSAMMIGRAGVAQPDDIISLSPSRVGTSTVGLSGGDHSEFSVNISGWAARRAVIPRTIEARPPGLSFGPFFEDWSLSSWLRSSTDTGDVRGGPSPAGLGEPVLEEGHRTVAMLSTQDAVGTGSSPSRRWMLYLECQRPAASATQRSEEVLVHLGGQGGEVTLRVFADGQVVTSRGGSTRAPVEQTDDRWIAWVTLPDSVLAEGQWVRLGITRTDASGLRSSWPRPMFPWEDLPPHAAIGLEEWDGFPQRAR